MRKVLLGFVALVLVLGSSAPSFADDDPAPGSPAWEERDRDNMAYSTARKQDEFSNVAAGRETFWGTLESYPQNLLDQLQHPDRPVVSFGQFIPGGSMIDPYRQRWDRGPAPRGIRWRTEYLNRYGSRIIANVWAPLPGTPNPVTGSPMHAPYPGIVITTGSIQAPQELYMWAAQGLAEAGYVVMTFDVQGQGRSELLPHPVEVFCDPNGRGGHRRRAARRRRVLAQACPPSRARTSCSARTTR